MSPTRRTLLGRTGLALGGGTLASLAGCLGGDPAATATDSRAGTSTPPPESSPASASTAADDGSRSTPPPEFTRWLPSPAQSPYRDGYGVSYVDMAAVRERRNALHEMAVERLEREFRNVLPAAQYVDADDVDAAFRFAFSTSVAVGSFDPSAFGERYRDEQRSRAAARTGTPATETATATPEDPERYGGFDLYGRRRVYAVSEDALVAVGGFAEGDLREYARAVIDARAGDASRYTDANAYADALFGLVGDQHRLTCYVEAMDGSTSRGFREDVITGGLTSWRFGPETTRLTYANTYPDGEAAEDASFEEYLEDEAARFGAYDGLDVRRDERLIWTDGTLPTREFDFLSAGGPAEGVYTPNG